MTSRQLRKARLARGWSQARLAKRARVSQATVSLAERWPRRVSTQLRDRITRALA